MQAGDPSWEVGLQEVISALRIDSGRLAGQPEVETTSRHSIRGVFHNGPAEVEFLESNPVAPNDGL